MSHYGFLVYSSHQGDGVVTITLPDGTVERILNVSPSKVVDKCPLLFHAFEDNEHGAPQASLEADSVDAVVSLIRFIYHGDYLLPEVQQDEVPLTRHAQVYKIGVDFDMPTLQVAAYVNFMTNVEASCSLPTAPLGLCEAIRYIYRHLAAPEARKEHSLVDVVVNYCVSSFKYHKLGESEEFRRVVFDLPDFHRDLCQTCGTRDYQEYYSDEIMRLPVSYSKDPVSKRALDEFQLDVAGDSDEPGPFSDSEDQDHKRRKSGNKDPFMVVHRFKDTKEVIIHSESESSSDEDGFTVVHRPKLAAHTDKNGKVKIESATAASAPAVNNTEPTSSATS